ncbi:MAG: L,D-transpeptidase family protein [Ginsengibacter sp.]
MCKQNTKHLFLFISLFCFSIVHAQNSFVPTKKVSFGILNSLSLKEELLQKEFKAKGLAWPAGNIFIRSFKYEGQLEVWAKDNDLDKYKLFKTYKVCMQSGALGPKRMQGDYQVPEGFYYINEFNPNSAYHLSLGLNYPNASDKILSDPQRPGNGIYIHGSCVSVGCIPVNDSDIEEIYLIASAAKASGEEFIPVHIFPIRYSKKNSVEYLENNTRSNPKIKTFALQLKSAYDKFEATKELPLILIDSKGDYVVN